MTRGQLPKAYLRLDPNIDHTHPEHLEAFIRLLCAASRQPHRGWFRSRAMVEHLLGKRATATLFDRGDLVQRTGGFGIVEVPGWDEWQEGDFTVGERMRLIRGDDGTLRTPGAARTANWRLRNQVFERDQFTCRYCGVADYERDWLVADHVIPSPAGATTLENLVTACRPCNKRKGGRTPEEAGMPLLPVPTGDPSRDTSPTSHVTGHKPVTPSEASRRLGVKASGDIEAEQQPSEFWDGPDRVELAAS
jgi:HNH endonuclease